MSEISDNPFLEGSEQIPDEEAEAAAKALAEEAAAVRARASEIKEKAAMARIAKEAARSAEIARMEAEVEMARKRLIETVASIPRSDKNSTFRPAPPPASEASVLSSGDAVVSESGKFSSLTGEPVRLVSFMVDAISAAAAVTFTFFIIKGM